MGCLAKQGHMVIGMDISETKNELINAGKATILEKDLDNLIEDGRSKGLVQATANVDEAIKNSQVSIICVGTPNNEHGNLSLAYIEQTARSIGSSLKGSEEFHVVAVRSTVVPGTCDWLAELIEEESGLVNNEGFAVISNPEFLREGTAIKDYFEPPMTVIGSSNERATEIMKSVYKELDAPIAVVETKTAEIIKFVNNSYHALKITFANEVGNICKSLGMDSHDVMELFGMDTKLNISTAYFKPGFAYGGSCLPKDLKGLVAIARDNHLNVPVLESVSRSNREQIRRALEIVYESGRRKVGILGLSFKEGTDDLRMSPNVQIAETLLGKGYKLNIFDSNVKVSSLLGKNRSYMQEHLPHLDELITDNLDDVIVNSEILVVCHKSNLFSELDSKYPNKVIIDLARNSNKTSENNYNGICW